METNDDAFTRFQKLWTPAVHRSMTSQLDVIKKCGQKVSKKGGVYYEKQTDSVNNPYKNNPHE